jgi:hypothetical protein
MGALGTGFSQGYHKQVGQAGPYPTPGGAPGVPPPFSPTPTKGAGDGGGGLRQMMGMFGRGEPSSGLEGLGQFTQGPVGGPPTGDGGMMKGFFPTAPGASGAGLKEAMGGGGGAAGEAGGIMSLLAKLGPLLAL